MQKMYLRFVRLYTNTPIVKNAKPIKYSFNNSPPKEGYAPPVDKEVPVEDT